MNNKEGFSVLDMASNYASDHDIDVEDLFRKNPVSGNIKAESEPISQPQSTIGVSNTKQRQPWVPDPKLTAGMADLESRPVVYNADEIKNTEDTGLKNIADDKALEDSRQAMDDMSRKELNIQDAKDRFGIRHLQIPEGVFHAKIFAAAGDTNINRAREGLDEIFKDIVNNYPEFIKEWSDPSKNPHNTQVSSQNINPEGNINPIHDPNYNVSDFPGTKTELDIVDDPSISPAHPMTPKVGSDETVKVLIDKSGLPDVTWNKEDMDKIRRAREVQLSIIEDVNLRYTNIEDAKDNVVDAVLSQYIRKVNDVSAPLPASRYRATFTGLVYTEILDLSHSNEMNNLDGERKKWSIAFDHIRNQSIGPWKAYDYYINPITNQKVIVTPGATIPTFTDDNGKFINVETVHISEFDDFLMKTDYLDIDWILWKVLCATAMDKEIISIDCHGKIDGRPCNSAYDWVYSPNDLLVLDSINPTVIEEMQQTLEASSLEEIEKCYKESMLNLNNTVELSSSKIGVVFGHISAYDYLNSIYAEIKDLENQDNPMLSNVLSHSMLTVIKSFLMIDETTGKTLRFSGTENIVKVINSLNEIDWQTLSEIVRIMLEPYQFRFALRDIRCSNCKTKSNIEIEDMSRLLFIVAQSLSSVQVVLKKV